jgi:hypothetical protein
MATQMTKSQLIEQIATKSELAKKDVKGVIETLAEIGYKELKKRRVSRSRLCQIRRHQEAGHQGPQRHQPVHGRGHDFQGEAGAQDRQGTSGQGGQGRGVRDDVTWNHPAEWSQVAVA